MVRKDMYEQLVKQVSSLNISGTISKYVEMLVNVVNDYLSGADNLRLTSVFLMITALVMFLLLVSFIYIKSIIMALRNNKQNYSNTQSDDIFDDDDALEFSRLIENQEKELELEKELQKELELALANRKKQNQEIENSEKENKEKNEQELKNKELNKIENKKINAQNSKNRATIDLDWKKGKVVAEQNNYNNSLDTINLSYRKQSMQLSDLTGLVVDMIARGVDDLKIAQTIMYRNNYMSSEEDVLNLVETIKEFIEMCKNQKFTAIINSENINSEEEALYYLAEGDPSLALLLLEKNMDSTIDEAEKQSSEAKKSAMFDDVAKSAILFGNLAAINDVLLATGAFELAIETCPHNVIAWSRLADMYAKSESGNKAIWAYQNVLSMADEEINPREVANANKNLSQHFYAQGNSLQAAKLYNSSKQYYDALGINRRLDKQEADIVDIIEQNHQNEVIFTVQKLLAKNNGNSFNFG